MRIFLNLSNEPCLKMFCKKEKKEKKKNSNTFYLEKKIASINQKLHKKTNGIDINIKKLYKIKKTEDFFKKFQHYKFFNNHQ